MRGRQSGINSCEMLHLESSAFYFFGGDCVRTMTFLLFFRDQGVASFQILLDEGVLELRDTLLQFP